MDLLRKFAEGNSEEAFETLVSRHVNMVYFAALRKTVNPHAAEEISQAVFIILAKKAGSLRSGMILSGWLYQTARLTAGNFLRNEIRRAHREQEAYMQSLDQDTGAETWQQIAPHLDDALGQLGDKDRNAIVLRFFEGKSFQEVGAAFGASENAAKKRVAYALEKLRNYFSKRGVVSTTAIIAGVVSANSVQAAPVGLAVAVVATTAKGSAVSGSTLTLVKGALKIMAWAKVKSAIVIGVSVLIATGATTAIVEKIKTSEVSESLTLKVNPEIFIRNIMARAEETMNTISDGHSEILLDVLKMEGFDFGRPSAPTGIAFNIKTGEITTHNTSESLRIFRRIVEDLNREDGERALPSINAPAKPSILITAQFYKMSSADFEKLGLGKPTRPGKKADPRFGTSSESPLWMLSQDTFKVIQAGFKSRAIKPFSSPRIQTANGIAASLYTGAADDNITFKCLPLASIDKKTIEMKVQASTTGKFNRNPEGDWTAFANRTNCAVFARAPVEIGGGLVFRAENPQGLPANNLVILIEVRKP